MAFWDISALVKLYVRERDSDRFREMVRASGGVPGISQLTLSEIHRALWAKEFVCTIPENRAESTYLKFRNDIEARSIEIIPFAGDVQDKFDRILPMCYCTTPVVPIRALDGLLLASALIARTQELVSTDSRLRAAGALFGLRVLPVQTE